VTSAVFVVGGVLGAHFVKLRGAEVALARLGETLVGGAGLGAVIRDVIHTGTVHTLFFIGAPALLLATGLFGWFRGPRTLFALEQPNG
jgi:hypothetical protein